MGQSLQPSVKEFLRELATDHTCDKRSPRSWFERNYPEYVIKNGFPDPDTLWRADTTETLEEHTTRKQKLLEDIFENDNWLFISLITHSYAVSAILSVLGVPKFGLGEGVMVPVFVRAEKTAQTPVASDITPIIFER